MEKKSFGFTKEGQEVFAYRISCGSASAVICDYGATILSLCVPGRDGKIYDVCAGYDNITSYEEGSCYFGATVGRNANRIGGAAVTIDGVTYSLEKNDHENNLHSGSAGTHAQVWEVKDYTEKSITLCYLSPHLMQGFPGDALMQVTYSLTADQALCIRYRCQTSKRTVMNMTNHCYFNLNGQDFGPIYDQELTIHASHYTPIFDEKAIPTGEIAPVEGTPFDFRNAKPIGADIEADDAQLVYGSGYDHNFVLDRCGEGLQEAARAYAPQSGICMTVLTDCPGIQFYSGNYIEGERGKGVVYQKRGAFCLETQYFPNAANEPNFAMPLLAPGEVYTSETDYRFSVR